MPRRDERYSLTIELKRDQDDLVRTYFAKASGEIAVTRAPFASLGGAYRARDERGLVALHGVLTRGDAEELSASLSGSALDRAGAALFETLFGTEAEWGPVLRAAFERPEPEPQPHPTRDALRVRICTHDPLLQCLPWRATMWSGRLLLDEDWTFEVCFDPAPETKVDLEAPGSILVIAPDFAGMPPIGTEAHLRALRQLFETLLPGHTSSPRFQVKKTLAEVERELRGMQPELVYFYGHGDASGDQLRLQLGDGRMEPVLMRDFARLLRDSSATPPKVVFLNGCQTGQSGWHSAGAQLLPDVPLVIANATTAWSESAGRFALRWLGGWLREGLDPVEALHQLGSRESTRGFEWITPVVHTHYQEFTTHRPLAASIRSTYFPADWLDREEQRARVFGYISELCRDAKRRAMAAIAFAPPGNHLERLSGQIIARVESEAGERLHIRHLQLSFPEQRATKDLGANLEHALKLQLRSDAATPLQHVLRAHAPRRAAGVMPVLWLDWGVFGDPPRRQPFLLPDQVTAWLRFVRDRIAAICPDDLRVVATVAMDAKPELLPKLGARLAAFESDPDFRIARFRFRAIPPLKDVELTEIIDYLEHTDCPVDILHELARLIYGAKSGHYEETVSLLQRGPPAWTPLRDELRRPAGDSAGQDAAW